MENKIDNLINIFEDCAKTDEEGVQFWYARELAIVLDYPHWQKFQNVIKKAQTACKKSGFEVKNHFNRLVKMVDIGSETQRSIEDIKLTRYACYLVAQNGNSKKKPVAFAQTYFAVQTRRKELDNQAIKRLSKEEKRYFLRKELKEHNKLLANAAKSSGVVSPLDYAIFQNQGYKGLYNGLNKKGIQEKKGLEKNQEVLDFMGSEELAANLFRATQTESKIKRESIKEKTKANKAHFEVGKKVRQTILELGGIMPEDLLPEEDIKKIEQRIKSKAKKELSASEDEGTV